MSRKDYYKVLGVEKKAPQAEIKSAFKKLARKYHPDVNHEKSAEQRFKEISEAYEVLGDEKKRAQYDQFGSFNFGSGGPRNPYSQNYWQSSNFNDVDLEDIFGDIFGMGGPKRGRKAGRSSFNFGRDDFYQQTSREGSDINWTLPIDFIEAANGCEKQILLTDGKKIKVKIPAGVDHGSKIRLAGKGNPGVAGGSAGNLIIDIQVNPHSYFKREGDNIHLDASLSLEEAVNGASIKVPTLTGMVQVKIPGGTQSGQKLRLKNKGVKNIKTQIPGDLFVNLHVKYPANLSNEDKDKLVSILEKYKDRERVWS
ncbi:MAG: DnaJ domain-containing protein [Deltaproteobacteria bacterium]|nr:DnaJ domain-containing protein [Deltaproteobacteria bacterium]